MAFTGSATIVQISDRKIRITGLSLASLAVGTIVCSDVDVDIPGGAIRLPASFQPTAYSRPDGVVGCDSSIEISLVPDAAVATAIPVEISKTGTNSNEWVASVTNNHGSLASPALEIWVEWH
jgi:hypothetical protein